ncbi:xanthine dehydrogenase family Fe-S subunit [Ancylobacter radicis]|uniref:2Fe-2S iron-sulfur cluster binding domain-containing protein n=1 Tax=Ancylobacter radicis TaxID=2836179 RepID=A0ABS5R8J5_9HYPH|nr:2Fe-2S iron-sulfur cluster-binding protein [Ancylobacter radicis]MBS9477994.1 2Fe-2S iron-sulfur cluster binding domain-containing protein [Ancylobacter radicis]
MNAVTHALSIEVNGRPIEAEVEPRQSLADFLREDLLLTGTHLGCEHGVCGACTILIDGAPARSCIAFPVALEGAKITTIEGLIDDPVMVELRAAFTREHALQCGFCTPGMLVMARDIVLRRPGLDTDAIRHELAGNLCRCTGYVGIIKAIQSVAAERAGEAPLVTRGTLVAPPLYASPLTLPVPPTSRIGIIEPQKAPAAAPEDAAFTIEPLRNPIEIVQEFDVGAPRATVWALFQDPARVIACLPGASLSEPSDGRSLKAEMRVKLGPMQAAFGGVGQISADPSTWSGAIDGRGVDARSATRVQARLVYRLEEKSENGTHVCVDVAYVLQGPLAQMSRGAIARDLAARLTGAFAANLDGAVKGGVLAPQAAPLDAGSLVLSLLKGWLARLFGRG